VYGGDEFQMGIDMGMGVSSENGCEYGF